MKLEIFKSSFGFYNLRTINGKPTEEMLKDLKANGYHWSNYNNCWYPATFEAKNIERNKKYVEDFKNIFFPEKSVQPEIIETENAENINNKSFNNSKEEIAYLKDLVNELQEERKKDLERIKILESTLVDENISERKEADEELEMLQEQAEIEEEIFWEKENTLTDEEEQKIIEEQNEPLSSGSFIINTKELFERADEIAREEEQETENDFKEHLEENESNSTMITPEELSCAKSILPTAQYVTTLNLSTGEEGDFYKNKIKQIAESVMNAPKIGKTDEMEEHPIVIRYFHPTGTESLVCEIGEDGEAYGFQCLNGDYEMAEWGYLDLNELKNIPGMEIDYHVPEGMTIERWLYKEQPDMYPEYAEFSNDTKTPFDIAMETGNDIEAISKALKKTNIIENKIDYARELADWMIQYGLDNSESQENIHISFDDILSNTDTPEEWLNNPENLKLIDEALAEHNDNELLEYDPDEKESEKEIEAEYKIMQEISKGLTPDEISLNLAKYKESLIYAQEKSQETWEDFYARNTTGFDTPQTIDEFRQAYEHNKKQFEYDVKKYTGWIKALEEVQPIIEEQNPLIKEEIHVSNEEWNALSHLADAAKMDWFYEETFEQEKLKIQDLNDLSTAWLSENLEKLNNTDFKMIKTIYKRANIELDEIEIPENLKEQINKSEQLTSKKDIKAIREQCREILKKSDSEITEADKVILAQYEGAGGINEENRTTSGILNEFYTPNNLVEKVWQIVDSYSPKTKTVLEPSAGVGKFANNRPNNEFTMFELDETSARINKILHPEANIFQGAYQKQFFDTNERSRNPYFIQPQYDVVIGNPPYGTYNDKYKGLGEGKEFDRYEEYFISKGLDALKDENSLLAFVVPSGFLNSTNDKQKEIIASKGKLIDAYRLPVDTFPTTDVGTDIIIMTSWEKDRNEIDLKNQLVGVKAHAQLTNERLKKRQENYLNNLSSGEWFKQHPEKILGEVKTRTNRFGKIEEYVAVHEGLTVQDELNKIDSMLPQIEQETKISNIPVENISKAFAEIYKDSPEKAAESTQEFTEALKQMDFHKLGHFILWGVAGGDKISVPVKAATKKIFENYTGKSFPLFEDIDDETEKRHLTELWFAKNTNVAHIDTWNRSYDLHSEQDVLEYLVSLGTGVKGGKEYINDFFEKNSNDQERIKFLINKYGWYGSFGALFDMSCNNSSKGIKVVAYITNPDTEEVSKFDRMVSWKEICNEIKRQRLLKIYLDKPVKKTVLKENNTQTQKESVQNEKEQISENKLISNSDKKYPSPALNQKWSLNKAPGEVMSAKEFSHLYGNDFDEKEFPIWAATDWEGKIDLSKLTESQLEYLHNSKNYIQEDINVWTHRVLFTSGDIYRKIEAQRELLNFEIIHNGENSEKANIYKNNITLLEQSRKTPLKIQNINFGLKSSLAEEFMVTHFDEDNNPIELNLQESFILWAANETLATQRYRGYIDFATANISREELGEEITFSDVVDYIDGKSVKAEALRGWNSSRMTEEEKKAEKAQRKIEADKKRQARSDVANKLFERYLHESLDEKTIVKLEHEYNLRFNSYVIPDYSKLPLFIDGMSAYKGNSKFKLYKQQIKGISFLCNKGNGLLAYDVGVGKTAAGIVATVNQLQTGRCKRALMVVPNQVYTKWYTDIKELFPNIKINELYNFNNESVKNYKDKFNPHKLNIPENSISLCTYEALKNITFNDESCENELFEDFANLVSGDLNNEGTHDTASTLEKIKGVIGAASHVKDESYYFFEDCGFDNLTVDEAHNFKNLWVVPRPKNKRGSNEYAGIPSGKPSNRALKMYAMTQLVQRHNNDRNVFMLTATPFTNSPTEVYSMLAYIGRERLVKSGIHSLTNFFDQFAQTKQELGVASNGEVDTKQVMKNWKNLPALQSILTEFIDKADGEEALIIRPYKSTHLKPLDMSELQKQMREMDEKRMAEVKDGNSAAIIVAMNNMRISCVAPALANPDMYEGLELPPLSELVETSPKLKFVCDSIIDMYKDNPEKGQFMYIPLGKESHGIIKDYLVKHGIPKEAVEIINGEINNTPEKKEKIVSKFNDIKNKCKIIIGGKNTSEGIDLNGNSFVMYNCSLGWNPSETIQAEGRIWRQNNNQGHVHIVYPVMNDSIDSVLYQKHDEKISRINELWNYKGDTLNVEDIKPEDLKFDLIKDPNKKAKLILMEKTKDARSELSHIVLKLKSYDDIIERRKSLNSEFTRLQNMVNHYEEQIKEYKDRKLEVPSWITTSLKNYKKEFQKNENQKISIENKLNSLNIYSQEDEQKYVENLITQKRICEEKIQNMEHSLPEILEELKLARLEEKVMEYPIEKQREILTADILNNLRPMKEVEVEIKTQRHEKMLSEKLNAGEITEEEYETYKAAGYEKYQKWLDGEIEFLDENINTTVTYTDNSENTVKKEIPDNSNINQDKKNSISEDKSDKNENTNPDNNLKDFINDENSLFYNFDNDDLSASSITYGYRAVKYDDKAITSKQITQAEMTRDKIILPILNGKESSLYVNFKDFIRHGVLDIVGAKIELSPDNKTISKTGWEQLHAAMNIYRDKQFETFRFILIDRQTHEVNEQLSCCCFLPNRQQIGTKDGATIKQVLTRAEETDSLIVAVHNHPSGNIEPSMEDEHATKALKEIFTRSDGLSRFAGHIILDHNSFSLYTPENNWEVINDKENVNLKDPMLKEDFIFNEDKIHMSDDLCNIANKINDINNWNDDFIPVVFVNAGSQISGVKLYEKTFFENSAMKIRNELQFNGFEAGAIRAFPIITEAFSYKIGNVNNMLFEERLKELITQNAFSDAVITDFNKNRSIVQKYEIEPGSDYFDLSKMNNPEIKATWNTHINYDLFTDNNRESSVTSNIISKHKISTEIEY